MSTLSQAGQKAKQAYYKTENAISNSSVSKWITVMARIGFAAKGMVYVLTGLLATMTAFGISGGEKAGKEEIFKIIYEQPFGKTLLAILAVGLFGYMVWRMVEAIKNPDNLKNDLKGNIKRLGFALSGLVYGAAAFYAVKMIINGSNSGAGSGRELLISKALNLPLGQWIVGAVAFIIIIKGIAQLYAGFANKYMSDIRAVRIKSKVYKIYKRAGKIGHLSRGVVFLIVGYFLFRAAVEFDPDKAKGTEQAMSFLQEGSYGPYFLGTVALGLIGYGFFMFIKARYKSFY